MIQNDICKQLLMPRVEKFEVSTALHETVYTKRSSGNLLTGKLRPLPIKQIISDAILWMLPEKLLGLRSKVSGCRSKVSGCRSKILKISLMPRAPHAK